jgi:hypothetical protein
MYTYKFKSAGTYLIEKDGHKATTNNTEAIDMIKEAYRDEDPNLAQRIFEDSFGWMFPEKITYSGSARNMRGEILEINNCETIGDIHKKIPEGYKLTNTWRD